MSVKTSTVPVQCPKCGTKGISVISVVNDSVCFCQQISFDSQRGRFCCTVCGLFFGGVVKSKQTKLLEVFG